MKTFLTVLLLLFVAVPLYGQIFPSPEKHLKSLGVLNITNTLSVNEMGLTDDVLPLLRSWCFKSLNLDLVILPSGGMLSVKRNPYWKPETYSVSIDNKIEIKYGGISGFRYALQTLNSLLEIKGNQACFSKCKIEDSPKYEWRGLHLDVSRHFFDVSTLTWIIDEMYSLKLNKLHLHLTDDQGWRFPVEAYPKLTSEGGFRKETLVGHASNNPAIFDGQMHGGFYSKRALSDLVAYAAERNIEIVPEIEFPGHSRAAIAAYPWLACSGEKLPVPGTWGVFEEVYCSKDTVLTFYKQVLKEVMEIFPGKYIHVGGDEVPKAAWKGCHECQAKKNALGLANEEALQAHLMQEISAFLRENGRNMIGWDEIMDGESKIESAIMAWRGDKAIKKGLEEGYEVVASPNGSLYFDHYQSKRSGEPLAIGGYTPFSEVANLEFEGYDLLGVQANLWTEYIPNEAQLQYMMYPRIYALAELAWSNKRMSEKELSEFIVQKKFPELENKGLNYSKAIFESDLHIEPSDSGLVYYAETFDQNSSLLWYKNGQLVLQEEKLVQQQSKFPSENKMMMLTKGSAYTDTLSWTSTSHSTLGMIWESDKAPHEFYSGTNSCVLSDGIYGTRPWNGSDWLGFREGPVTFTLELPREKSLSEVTMSFLHAPSSWIYLPDSIELMCTDKRGKQELYAFTVNQELQSFTLPQAQVKTIQITVVPKKIIPTEKPGAGQMPWLFMDEIMLDLLEPKVRFLDCLFGRDRAKQF